MPTYYFCPVDAGVAAETVSGYASSYLSSVAPQHVGTPGAVLGALPATLDLDEFCARLDPGAREGIRSRLVQKEQQLRPTALELVPGLTGEPRVELKLVVTAEAWKARPAGTVLGIRRSAPVQVVAVFDEWRIDAGGQVSWTPSAPTLLAPPPHVPARLHAANFAVTSDPAQTFADVVLTLTNYVGQFLSMTGMPGIGLLISLLSSQTQQAVDGSFARGPGLLDVFKKLLQANRITLENDLAGAVILNYRDYAHTHYNDAWLDQVMTAPDPLPSDVKDKIAKLEGFTAKITEDFDSTSDLFTAVDTMRVSSPQPGDVHDATEAMLKSEGFFYMANVALTLGRQAFNAKYTMDGPGDAAKVADLLASYSQIYSDYAAALKVTVDQQVASRTNLIHSRDAGGEVYIWDDYYPSPAEGAMAYLQKCCGRGDCDDKARDRDRAMAQMRIDRAEQYRKDLCGRFWDGTHQSFDQAVASMQDNNAKLQKLAQQCKEQS